MSTPWVSGHSGSMCRASMREPAQILAPRVAWAGRCTGSDQNAAGLFSEAVDVGSTRCW